MILIAGQAGVGKSTLAAFVAQQAFKQGLTPVLLAFASPIKEDAVRKGYGKEVNPEKYRKYCQDIGAARRLDDPDYWVLRFDTYVQQIREEERKDLKNDKKFWERVIIVDDARYLNELAYGSLYNAATVFISSRDRKDLDLDAMWRDHESEELSRSIDSGTAGNVLKTFTNIVFNDDGIDGFKDVAKELTPVWCGLTADTYCSKTSTCTCTACNDKRKKDFPKLKTIIDNLIDLLFLSDPEADIEEEENDDEDS